MKRFLLSELMAGDWQCKQRDVLLNNMGPLKKTKVKRLFEGSVNHKRDREIWKHFGSQGETAQHILSQSANILYVLRKSRNSNLQGGLEKGLNNSHTASFLCHVLRRCWPLVSFMKLAPCVENKLQLLLASRKTSLPTHAVCWESNT